jgi:alpha/beta superfamily hydrolase
MNRHEQVLLDGPDGPIELFVEAPLAIPEATNPAGIALIAHPHPLFGGTADNKVVTTLAKAFRERSCVSLRPNFRGVGGSVGTHDHGIAETEDLLAVHAYARGRFGAVLPVYLAGFSFGAYVISRLAQRLTERGDAAARLVLVGTAAGFIDGLRDYATAAVPADSIVIHGAADTTVPLANVLAWAEPLNLPVTVIPGADHFFHRRLHLLRTIIHQQWGAAAQQ